jgi:GNAT superfamily N-acetyltransferase
MEVTLATVADAHEIAAVKAIGWRSTYAQWVPDDVLAPLTDVTAQAAELAAALSDPADFAVLARDDTRLLGFATCLSADREEPLLDSFHVLPDARGRGVGAAILHQLAAELTRRGATTLTVAVVEQNTRTRELYERLGAIYVKTEPAAWAPDHVREAHYRWDDLAPL